MSFFKAYDMRGTFGVDFDLDMVYRVGRALPQVVPGKRWLIGRDCRLSSMDIRDALVAGLKDAGVEVTDLGLCTTSRVYFFTGEDDFDGSVMITASHNPPSDNGLKVSRKGARPVSYASGLKEVEKIVEGELRTKNYELGMKEDSAIPNSSFLIPNSAKAADERRRALWSLNLEEGRLAEEFGGREGAERYADALFGKIHRTDRYAATARQVWAVIFTLRNRAKGRARRPAHYETDDRRAETALGARGAPGVPSSPPGGSKRFPAFSRAFPAIPG